MVRAQQRSAAIADAAERGPARLDDERAYLYQIIQTIGSGPDLETILGGIVRLATQATGCHACLIWFLDGDRLVLRSSSAPYEHLAGVVSMELGEGLAGWVVKTRRSAFIKEQSAQGPPGEVLPGVRGGAVPIARIRSGVRPRRRRDGGHLLARRGAA